MFSGIRSAVSVSRLARLLLIRGPPSIALFVTVPARTPRQRDPGHEGGAVHRRELRPAGWRAPGAGSRVAAMPSTWRGNVYLVLSFVVGLTTFTVLVTAISVGVSLLIVWVGVPTLVASVAASRWLAGLERRRVGWRPAEPVPATYLTPHRTGMLGRLHTAIGDAAMWK